MKYVLLMVLIILIVVNVTFVVQVSKDVKKIKDKIYPKSVQCNKCGGHDITERSDNPASLPSIKSMNEIASCPAISIITENAVMRYYEHTLTCNTCGYVVKFTRTY